MRRVLAAAVCAVPLVVGPAAASAVASPPSPICPPHQTVWYDAGSNSIYVEPGCFAAIVITLPSGITLG